MSWRIFEDGTSIGARGSELGIIILDEEYEDAARISLERCTHTALFAITCGLYGWMVHTRFFGTEDESRTEFDAMKLALAELVVRAQENDDPSEMSAGLKAFMERFP